MFRSRLYRIMGPKVHRGCSMVLHWNKAFLDHDTPNLTMASAHWALAFVCACIAMFSIGPKKRVAKSRRPSWIHTSVQFWIRVWKHTCLCLFAAEIVYGVAFVHNIFAKLVFFAAEIVYGVAFVHNIFAKFRKLSAGFFFARDLLVFCLVNQDAARLCW